MYILICHCRSSSLKAWMVFSFMQSKCKFDTSELHFHVGLCYFMRPAHQIPTASPLRQLKQGKNIGLVLLKCSLFPLLSLALPPAFFSFFFSACYQVRRTFACCGERDHSRPPRTISIEIFVVVALVQTGGLSACALDSVKVNGTREPLQRKGAAHTDDRGAPTLHGMLIKRCRAALSEMTGRRKNAKWCGRRTSGDTKYVAEMWELKMHECVVRMLWSNSKQRRESLDWTCFRMWVRTFRHVPFSSDNELVSRWCRRVWRTWWVSLLIGWYVCLRCERSRGRGTDLELKYRLYAAQCLRLFRMKMLPSHRQKNIQLQF